VKPFVNGGASGMLATCVIQPIDMVKVSSYAWTAERDFGVCGQWSRLLYSALGVLLFCGWLPTSQGWGIWCCCR
jgi:hypothetical protein